VLVDRRIVGALQANCYLLAESANQQAVIVDPGDELSAISEMIVQSQVNVIAILCTHGHPDHIGAAVALAEVSNIDKVYLHPAEVAILSQLGVVEMAQHLHTCDEGDQIGSGN